MSQESNGWVKLSEDDHHTTLAMTVGFGALVKNLSFEPRITDGMNITVQISESMSYVPNVVLQVKDEDWQLVPHYAGKS